MALGTQHRPSFVRMTSSDISDSHALPSPQQMVARLAELRAVHEAFAWFRAHSRELGRPATRSNGDSRPTLGRGGPAEWLRGRFEQLGLSEVHQDELGNVFGVLPGADARRSRFIALSAHLDTVFPAGTPISVIREGGKLYGPGISDNGSGITALACHRRCVARDLDRTHCANSVDRQRWAKKAKATCAACATSSISRDGPMRSAATIVLDGAGTDTVIAEGLGSRRYEVTVRGPGGHSWSDFGIPNPVVALARIIERFSATSVPSNPKTTFNIGTVEGGTSVNSIPAVRHHAGRYAFCVSGTTESPGARLA